MNWFHFSHLKCSSVYWGYGTKADPKIEGWVEYTKKAIVGQGSFNTRLEHGTYVVPPGRDEELR